MASLTELSGGMVLDNKYVIERVIGIGGFGITYYAHHKDLLFPCAIKEFFISGKCVRDMDGKTVIYQDLNPQSFQKYRTRFLQEAQTLAKLNNKHVVHVHNVFEENNTAYICMDYIAGETLQQRVSREGFMSYDLAINFIAQITEAVEHIHAHHILHRDIKPDNIIITPENNAVLIDFGSARSFVHDEVANHTTILTPGYAPIEQYSADTKKGNYTDIYSLAGVFYFLVTGQKPLDAAERFLDDKLVEPITINNTLPASVNATIMKALRMKTDERYQTVAAFRNDLLSVDDEPVSGVGAGGTANPQPDGTGLQHPKKDSGLLWLWISLGVAVVILAFILILRTLPARFKDEQCQFETPKSSTVTLRLTNKRSAWITSQPEWCDAYVENGAVIVSTLDNHSEDQRGGFINICSEGLFGQKLSSVYVIQSGNYATYLSVDNSTPQFNYTSSSMSVYVNTDGVWEFDNTRVPNWLTRTRSGDCITLKVKENTTYSARECTFYVKVGGQRTPITVRQKSSAGTYLTLSTYNMSFGYTESSQIVTVNCDGKWTIDVGLLSSYGSVVKTDDSHVRVTMYYNSGSRRTDWFRIRSGNITRRVNVSQN